MNHANRISGKIIMVWFIAYVINLYHEVLSWLNLPNSLLSFTDPKITYDNPYIKTMWQFILILSDSAIGVFIALAGYQLITSGFGARYSAALEILPRLLFAFIGANLSLAFGRFWIDFNNLACAFLMTQAQPLSLLLSLPIINPILMPLCIVLILLFVILGVQMIIRLALIIFLLVCLPVAFLLLAHHQTKHIGQSILTTYVYSVMLQTVQLLCLVMGTMVLIPFLSNKASAGTGAQTFVAILAEIALLWLALRIPRMLRNSALQPVAEGAAAIGAIIQAGLLRALK
jgi:hypothetical protein